MSGALPIRTPEEATPIAEANTGLLYAAVDRYRNMLPRVEFDDLVGIAQLPYWRSCLAWDPSSGTLGTLVFKSVFNAFTHHRRHEGKAKRTPPSTVSSLGEWHAPTPPAEIDDSLPWWWTGVLTEEDRAIVTIVAKTGLQTAAADGMGRSRNHINKVIGEMRAALVESGVTPGSAREAPRRHRPSRARQIARASR